MRVCAVSFGNDALVGGLAERDGKFFHTGLFPVRCTHDFPNTAFGMLLHVLARYALPGGIKASCFHF